MRRVPLLLALLVAGCGSAAVDELPPGAGPAASPPAPRAPAGRVVRVGAQPEGIAVASDGLLGVALGDPARLAVVDGRTGRVLRRLALPGPARHLAAGGADGTVLIPTGPAGRLLRVRLADGRVLADVRVAGRAHEAASAGSRVVVSDERGDALRVVRRGRVDRTLRAPAQPGGVAMTADGALAAVVAARERVLALYDTSTGRRLGVAPAGVGPTHVVIHGGDAYVTDTRGGSLLVYALRPELALVRRVSLRGSPYGLAVDSARDRLWVTLTAENELAELPATRLPRIVRHFPAVRQPNSVAVDPRSGRVFVTGRVAGVVQLVDP